MLDANHTITPWYMELLIDPNDKVFLQGWQDPGGSDVYAADELGVLMLCICTDLHCWPHDWDIIFCT
jgi:hypothetical protein